MHMADALISPAVGGTMWALSSAAILYCSRKIERKLDDFKVPLMGVMGAFIFAAQMINFTIPGTGSSGHICGSILLAALLGPYAALLVISSVLVVQALIFADGGLLALGCNIFNMGVIPTLIAYPLIYKTIVGANPKKTRLFTGAIAASVIGLQLGAAAVVIQTWSSGMSALPLGKFMMLMLSIHLGIGFIEGVITASVLFMIRELRPGLLMRPLASNETQIPRNRISIKSIVMILCIASLIIGGIFSWFASEYPDGLEWAVDKIPAMSKSETPEGSIHSTSEKIQNKSSILPDYGFKNSSEATEEGTSEWGDVNIGTTVSGITGAAITLTLVMFIGFILRKKRDLQKA